ncbi:MAG: ATPase P [Gemmatimonadetes bacterium]|nr:MAG: ATPase P [Gemmatimonadota bacterium]
MLQIQISGGQTYQFENLVLDYNGTLAIDGHLIDGVADRLRQLADYLKIHVITADTFGTVERALAGLPCQVVILTQADQTQAKGDYVQQLGANRVVAIGNGQNDSLMLERAALGIATIQEEGAATATLVASDLVVTRIDAGLDILLHPQRLNATLRSGK